jgi:alpha-tubulin suppressor-like RCC1 family protein
VGIRATGAAVGLATFLGAVASCAAIAGLENRTLEGDAAVTPDAAIPPGTHDATGADATVDTTTVDTAERRDAATDGCTFQECDGGCVDTDTDPAHCGVCDNACAAGVTCYAGSCGGGDVLELAIGEFHTCARLRGGEVWCWGGDNAAQIVAPQSAMTCPPNGIIKEGGPCQPAPVKIQGLSGIVQVAAGLYFTCALASDGGVSCWGLNTLGELGHDPSTDPTCGTSPCQAVPEPVAGLPSAMSIAAGGYFACAVTGNGAVWCWGDDGCGQLGPEGTSGPTPVKVLQSGATQVAAGQFHACAEVSSGVMCWGTNFSGELGHVAGDAGHDTTCENACLACGKAPCSTMGLQCNPTPTMVLGLPPVVSSVHAGNSVSCADTQSGPYCWGVNTAGTLGLGASDAVSHQSPSMVVDTTAQTVDVGYLTACGVSPDGGLECWGDDETFETTDTSPPDCADGVACDPSPVRVLLASVVEVRTGVFGVVARTTNGAVWTWGWNPSGQLAYEADAASDQACLGLTDVRCTPTPSLVIGLP